MNSMLRFSTVFVCTVFQVNEWLGMIEKVDVVDKCYLYEMIGDTLSGIDCTRASHYYFREEVR